MININVLFKNTVKILQFRWSDGTHRIGLNQILLPSPIIAGSHDSSVVNSVLDKLARTNRRINKSGVHVGTRQLILESANEVTPNQEGKAMFGYSFVMNLKKKPRSQEGQYIRVINNDTAQNNEQIDPVIARVQSPDRADTEKRYMEMP